MVNTNRRMSRTNAWSSRTNTRSSGINARSSGTNARISGINARSSGRLCKAFGFAVRVEIANHCAQMVVVAFYAILNFGSNFSAFWSIA